MKAIKERLAGYVQTKPTPVRRNGHSYQQTYNFTHRVLRICLYTYKRLQVADQLARLIRDLIDWVLRRYHNYCIKENYGAHYREIGLNSKNKVDFEHVIPAAIARDLLIYDRITIDEAMNIPTCVLSRKKHQKLNKKLASTTPDLINFWERYKGLKIKVETYDGTPVDMSEWDIETHYTYFKIG